MPQLELTFLGALQTRLDGKPLVELRSSRVQNLLAYLVLKMNPSHARATLAAFFWPEEPEAVAKQNLRQALYQLRQQLDGSASSDPQAQPFLLIERDTVQFNLASAYTLDVANFWQLLKQQRYAEAVQYYQGDLLTGLSSTSERFEEWLLLQREQLHIQAVDALVHLSEQSLQRADFAQTQHYARRLLAFEPWREDAHRYLIAALAHSGDRTAALAQYETCRLLLAEELGAEPDAETEALVAAIRNGDLRFTNYDLRDHGVEVVTSAAPAQREDKPYSDHQSLVNPKSKIQNRADWGEAPDVGAFHGRQAELAELKRWVVGDSGPGVRLVSILGMGGMGKTALAVKLCQQVAGEFEFVIWRSLLNAPPLSEILHGWQQLLTGQPGGPWPDGVDAQLALIFTQLRQHRCLLVLDNIESILQGEQAAADAAGRAGYFRAGYENYGQLLKRCGETTHQSCLLLTSREQTQEIARLERTTPLARSLPLTGLTSAAGQAILQSQGVRGARSHTDQLIERYSGNPLALLLIAETIGELFDGDIALFLDDAPIFDDIRDVLDQQFARLTPLERAILLWLAIERESVTLAQISQNFVQPVPKHELLAALNSLRRRSLLEKSGDLAQGERNPTGGFLLQNVVTEYLTDYLVSQCCQEVCATQPRLLKSHALLKAQAKEYLRAAQVRFILQPIGNQLQQRLGRTELARHLKQLLLTLDKAAHQPANYVAGNVLNLCLHLGIDLQGWDFGRLMVREAYLRGKELPNVNFREADLSNSVFTDTFSFVFSVQFSPDGALLAAGTSDGEIRLWQVADWQLVGICRGHTGDIWSIAFSPDGVTLASASEDLTIRIWDVRTYQCLQVLRGHTGIVWSVAYSPDGRWLASGSRDQTVGLWAVATGVLHCQLQGHTNDVKQVAFSPTNVVPPSLLSGGLDHTIRLWDVNTGQLLDTLATDGSGIDLAFHPSGEWFTRSSADGVIELWDCKRRQVRHQLKGHSGLVMAVAFSPDGKLLVSGGIDHTVRLWDVESGQMRQCWQEHQGAISSVAFHPNGALLVSSSVDHTICFWDVHLGKLLDTFHGYQNWPFGVVIDPIGQMVVSALADHTVRRWATATGQELPKLRGHQEEVIGLAINQTGRLLASASSDNTVRLWDAQSGQALQTLRGHTKSVRAVAFSPTADLLASISSDQTVRLWDIQHGQCRLTLHGHRAGIRTVAFSPDGQTLVTGGDDQRLFLWDWQAEQVRHVIQAHTDVVASVAYHPDGRWVASGSWDQTIGLWDGQSGQLWARLIHHVGRIWALAFSPDGEYLASAGDAPQIYLWQLSTGQLHRAITGHQARIWSLAFTQDGSRLVSSSTDRTVKVWEVRTGVCQQTLQSAGPYAGMDITGVTGLSTAQKAALKALGAVET